jgi:hypothetical protein
MAERNGCGEARAALAVDGSKGTVNEMRSLQIQFPALIAQVRADECHITPMNPVERLCGACQR